MIRVTTVPESNIIELEVEGSVTTAEFDETLAQLETAINEHGEIRILEIVHSLDAPPIPWSKFWEDIKFSIEHLSDITHVAVVTDYAWIATSLNFLNPLFRAEFQVFKHTELETARIWLENASD